MMSDEKYSIPKGTIQLLATTGKDGTGVLSMLDENNKELKRVKLSSAEVNYLKANSQEIKWN
jgi:hypothetical protein